MTTNDDSLRRGKIMPLGAEKAAALEHLQFYYDADDGFLFIDRYDPDYLKNFRHDATNYDAVLSTHPGRGMRDFLQRFILDVLVELEAKCDGDCAYPDDIQRAIDKITGRLMMPY